MPKTYSILVKDTNGNLVTESVVSAYNENQALAKFKKQNNWINNLYSVEVTEIIRDI